MRNNKQPATVGKLTIFKGIRNRENLHNLESRKVKRIQVPFRRAHHMKELFVTVTVYEQD
jgi:hypothetical protein